MALPFEDLDTPIKDAHRPARKISAMFLIKFFPFLFS
jgi:hypothetical protein